MSGYNLIIYGYGDLLYSKSAGGNRIAKYAKALAEVGCKIYICSYSIEGGIFDEFYENCWYVSFEYKKKKNIYNFIKNIYGFSKSLEGKTVLLLYPLNKILMEWMSLLYLKYYKKKKLFIEVNEVRIYYKDWSVFRMIPLKDYPIIFIKFLYSKIAYYVTDYIYPYFDGMIFISKNIEYYYKSIQRDANGLRIPILCESVIPQKSSLAYERHSCFYIGFSGQIRIKKENINLLLNALHRLCVDGYKIVLNLYGPMIDKMELDKLTSQYDLINQVIYNGDLCYEKLKKEIKINNLMVLVRGNTKQNYYGFSTKLSDYLSSGIPLLVTSVSDIPLFIEDSENGFIIEPDNADLIYLKIKYIIDNYNNLSNIVVKNAFKLVESDFLYSKYGKKLKQFLFGFHK